MIQEDRIWTEYWNSSYYIKVKVNQDWDYVQQSYYFFRSEAESEIDSVSFRCFKTLHESFAMRNFISDQTKVFV